MTQWLAGMRITAARLRTHTVDETITSGLVAATGFEVSSFVARKISGLTTMTAYVTRTGGTITASGGNIGDTLLATLPSGWTPPDTISAGWGSGYVDGECSITAGGAISLRTANGDITGTASSPSAPTNLRVTATWVTTP